MVSPIVSVGNWIGEIPNELREPPNVRSQDEGRREASTLSASVRQFEDSGFKCYGTPRWGKSYVGSIADVLGSNLPCPDSVREAMAEEFRRVLGMPAGESVYVENGGTWECSFWTRAEVDRALLTKADDGRFAELSQRVGYKRYEDNDISY